MTTMPNRPMTDQEIDVSRKLTAYLNARMPDVLDSLVRGSLADVESQLDADPTVAPHQHAARHSDPGRGRSQEWEAEDGWLIGYSTTRIVGGQWDGKFIVTAHKPIGRGSRSGRGKVNHWQISYSRAFATRKAARARAEVLYRQHSPKWAAEHPTTQR